MDVCVGLTVNVHCMVPLWTFEYFVINSGPPTLSVEGASIVLLAVRLSSSSSVDVCNTPQRNVTHEGRASSVTSCQGDTLLCLCHCH